MPCAVVSPDGAAGSCTHKFDSHYAALLGVYAPFLPLFLPPLWQAAALKPLAGATYDQRHGVFFNCAGRVFCSNFSPEPAPRKASRGRAFFFN